MKADASEHKAMSYDRMREQEKKPKAKGQENLTDPDSRIMKTGSSGFQQSYHAQIIVAAQVTQCASDAGQLVPVVNAEFSNTATTPARDADS